MARYVLLEFDDDADAIKFTEDVQAQDPSRHDDTLHLVKGTVRAVFKKPTKSCECLVSGKRSGAFTRGKKYGWWVHTVCGKPTRGWIRGEHWFLALGRNLLPRTPEAPEYRGDGIFTPVVGVHEECGTPTTSTIGHGAVSVYCPTCDKEV